MTLDDVEPGVTTQRYHNNRRLIMLEVSCIKFSLGIQNSLGMIMCKFHARQSKTEGMAASVRVFLEHPSYSRREKLSLQYAIRLAANPSNPVHEVTFPPNYVD